MSFPPPPGLPSSTAQPHASLPARPPPSAVSSTPSFKPPSTSNGGAKPAFTAFAPRSIASSQNFRTSSPAHYSAAPVTSYSSAPSYAQPPQNLYQPPPSFADASSYTPAAPQIRNPFVPAAGNASDQHQSSYDPEMEAQIQQWQSAYMSKDDSKTTTSSASRREGPTGANTAPIGSNSRIETASPSIAAATDSSTANKTVPRSGGGSTWQDSTLLEWDPAHFRIFVGNLAGEVTDESLLKAFSKYPSVQKARVIRDKRTTKSKGYGFVSFSDGDDYFRAAREMQGKYIGSHPVLLKRSTTEVKAVKVPDNRKGGKFGKGGHKGGGSGGGTTTEYGGVQKKVPKTKGGLKVLG